MVKNQIEQISRMLEVAIATCIQRRNNASDKSQLCRNLLYFSGAMSVCACVLGKNLYVLLVPT